MEQQMNQNSSMKKLSGLDVRREETTSKIKNLSPYMQDFTNEKQAINSHYLKAAQLAASNLYPSSS